ncbi:hypothetical protein KR074_011723 [Drosophila pseudoananassae]|nr:hypothetical protein KR074_011723 [Drosophila pseudoananassae]
MEQTESTIEEKTAKDAIALRRELRRKKILEASKSRLDKLNGRATSIEKETLEGEPTTPEQYSDPEVEPDIPIKRSFLPEQPAPPQPNGPNILVKSRVHIILAAIVGFVLALYTNSSVFVPVLLFAVLEFVFFQYHKRETLPSNLGPMLILLMNPQIGNRVKQFNNIFVILQSFLGDLAITVCVLCLGSIILLGLNTEVVTIVK